MTDNPNGPPMYERIAATLAEQIRNGDLAPGSKLPSERALVDQYGVSVATTRKALSRLREAGLIYIRPTTGAFVRDWLPILRDETRLQTRELWGLKLADSDRFGDAMMVPDQVKIFRDEPAPETAAALECSEVVVRWSRYTADGRPVRLETVSIPADIAADTDLERKDPGLGGIEAVLAELGHEPVAFRERIAFRPPLNDEAKSLRTPPGMWVVEILHHAADDAGRVVEESRHVLDAASYVLQYSYMR